MGRRFGYPKCCIDDFCKRGLGRKTFNQTKVGSLGYGFIPCPDHARQIIEGEIKIESLIKNRDRYLNKFPGI